MRKFSFFWLYSFLLAMGLSSGASMERHEKQLIEAKKLISEGVDRWDEQIMLDARILFEECLPKSDEMRWLADYYVGYSDFRLTIYYRIQNKRDLQLKYLEDGIEHLYAALDSKDDFAESHALLALLVGQKARMDLSQMASLGMEAQGEISEARELGKENPRVAMISGVMYFLTPEQFGGNKIRAVEEIKRSLSLFKTALSDDERFPDWGRNDALVWLSRMYMETGEFELARRSLEEVLEVNPQNIFAQRVKQQLMERTKKP